MDSSLTSPPSDTPGKTPELPAPKRSRRRFALAGAVLTAFLLTGCTLPTFGAYKGATSQARTELHLWQGFFIAGLIVGGFVLLLIIYALIRYRRRSEEMPRQTQYHTLTEIIYTVMPIVIVIGLFIATVFAENSVDATPPVSDAGANIAVHAFQWGWEFVYPNGSQCLDPTNPKTLPGGAQGHPSDAHCVKVIGQTTQAPTMWVPVGTSTHIMLDSLDVLHGFYVPEFNFSRYASPGYTTTFNFNVLHAGVYRGQCTQLCGLYHSLMFFNVKAVSRSQFNSWLASAQQQLNAHPNSGPQLPGNVHSSGSGGQNLGSDLYSD